MAENASTGLCAMVVDAVIATLLKKDPAAVIEDLKIVNALNEIEGTYKSPHNMYSLSLSLSLSL